MKQGYDKQTAIEIPEHCFDCEEGRYERITKDHIAFTQDGNEVVVRGVDVLRCLNCGKELFPLVSLQRIRNETAAVAEQLTRKELFAFLEQFNVTQTEAAEALGLGEKTFHRWLRGTQVVSRSMGYYLRALLQFPEVFDWVRGRGWRSSQSGTASSELVTPTLPFNRFQALQNRNLQTITVHTNAVRGLSEAVLITD